MAPVRESAGLAEADVPRSRALLEAAGYTVLPELVRPVHGVWHLVATLPSTPIALLLVAVLRERPTQVPGLAYGPPPGWSPCTRRLLHVMTSALTTLTPSPPSA